MRYFDADALEFLGDLRRHNDRTWFNEHKERYERALREPFLEFIADAGPELRTISRNLVADPRPSGGSLFRIHRDARFSNDKVDLLPLGQSPAGRQRDERAEREAGGRSQHARSSRRPA